jgi:hypothetical protein
LYIPVDDVVNNFFHKMLWQSALACPDIDNNALCDFASIAP